MNTVVVVLNFIKSNKKIDVEVPLDITANELIKALNTAYRLGINTENMMELYLRSENPIALLRGNRKLEDFKIKNGSTINIVA